MVVSHGETFGDVLGEAAEMPAHALADRFQRLEARGAGGGRRIRPSSDRQR